MDEGKTSNIFPSISQRSPRVMNADVCAPRGQGTPTTNVNTKTYKANNKTFSFCSEFITNCVGLPVCPISHHETKNLDNQIAVLSVKFLAGHL